MNITQLTTQEESNLESFKSLVWPTADKEHYGDNQPKFFKDEFTLIAKENDQIIGYITITIDSGVAHLEPLMIHPEFQGKGIGTELLKAAEEKVKSLGGHKIWLETGLDWKAKNFYEKNGYNVRTILPNHTDNRDFVLMDKMI